MTTKKPRRFTSSAYSAERGAAPLATRHLLAAAVLLWTVSHVCDGQVVLDGSLGTAGARSGPSYVIPQSVGRLEGTNLFHSFSQFSINTGESATFTAVSGTPISSVIARVTGGAPSDINGLLRCAIPNANFFLVNPSGVIFGPQAQLDVQGSFVVTTANDLRFSDGAHFAAAPSTGNAVLTSAPPIAFGFLPLANLKSPLPGAAITYSAPASATAGQPAVLAVPQGQSISLIGGPVRIEGGRLLALAGQVNLVSVAGSGEVTLDISHPGATPEIQGSASSSKKAPSPVQMGPIDLISAASLASPVGGRVVVRAGTLNVNASSINADTDVVNGSGIDLIAAQSITLTRASISAQTTGASNGGSIQIHTGAMSMSGLSSDGSAPISVSTTAGGRGGNVYIDLDSLNITSNAVIQAFTTSSGAGGNISVTATRDIHIDGTGSLFQTGLAAETRSTNGGPGGDVTVKSPRVELLSEGEITSLTRGGGPAGRIDLDVGQLLIDGAHQPNLTGLQGRVGLGDEDAGASGPGGVIRVRSHRIVLRDGGVITASTFGSGNGGSIDIKTDALRVDGTAQADFTGVFAQSFPVPNLISPGRGGSIDILANQVRITGPAMTLAGISARSTSGSDAGRVRLSAHDVLVGGQGAITVQAPGGQAGDLSITTSDELAVRSGTISAQGGTGGNIHLNAGQTFYALHGSITARADRDGGQIVIDPPAVALDGGTIINGLAGGRPVRVHIDGPLIKSRDSQILTNAHLVFPETDLAGALIPLGAGLSDAGSQLAPDCGAILSGNISSFIMTGRGGTPPEPEGWQPDWKLSCPPIFSAKR